jgi:hypothetical protein
MSGSPPRKDTMKGLLSKRWIATFRIAACTLVILACQLPCLMTQQVGVPSPPGVNGGPTTQAPGGAVTNPTSDVMQGEVVFGPGPFSLMDPTVGLSDLNSYKATLTVSFEGMQDGQPKQWSRTYVMLDVQEPAARQITIDAPGADPAPVYIAEVNGARLEVDEENNCTVSLSEAGNSLEVTWEPAGFLSGLIGAEAAGSEMINDISTEKYTFDERALAETGFTQSTGQVWVASENGVVIRYLLSTTAGADYFGEGVGGTKTWEYNLTDVNQPVTIQLPTGCTALLVDAPLLPDAQNVSQLVGYTIYSSASDIAEVLAFYQEQLPPLGWKVTQGPSLAKTLGWVRFENGAQELAVIVTPLENGAEIRLFKGPVTNLDVTP